MSFEHSENVSSDDLNRLKDLPEFREMKMRAEAAEAKLRRIYNTPIWRLSKPLRKSYARLSQSILKRKEKRFIFTADPNEGIPVINLVKEKVTLESNNANLKHHRIAVVAHYSQSDRVTESLAKYLNCLLDNSYSVILVSASESPDELIIDKNLKEKISILRKPNLGYDFGSWAVVLDKFPEILSAEKLLLTNDSLIGPMSDFSAIIKDLEESPFDITGITDNLQLQYHIQSYLMLFKSTALKNLNIQNFLKSVVHLGLKNDVILKYELGLTRTAQLSGLFVGAIFPWNIIVQPGKNPSLAGWKRLIDLGFPFLKREAVRLASHSEVKLMTQYIQEKYPQQDWALAELKSVSK